MKEFYEAMNLLRDSISTWAYSNHTEQGGVLSEEDFEKMKKSVLRKIAAASKSITKLQDELEILIP